MTQQLAPWFSTLHRNTHWIPAERLWVSLLPSSQRQQTLDSWHTIDHGIGAFLHGQIIYGLVVALLLGLGYWLLGSPFPALLTLIGALACLIPVVGPALVLIPVLLVGLLTSVQLGLSTALYALVVLIALAVWVKPRMFNLNCNNPLMTLMLLLLMADTFGLAGIILALPLSVAYQIIRSRLGRPRIDSSIVGHSGVHGDHNSPTAKPCWLPRRPSAASQSMGRSTSSPMAGATSSMPTT